MAITLIKNLTKDKVIFDIKKDADGGDGSAAKPWIKNSVMDQFVDGKDRFMAKVTFSLKADFTIDFFESTDNIEVTWTDGRGVGGKMKRIDAKNFSIDGLEDYSKFTVDFFGTIQIGPKSATTKVANLSVRVGNNNPEHETIINLSDGEKGAPSTLDLAGLIAWIKDNIGGDVVLPTLPPAEGEQSSEVAKSKEFILEFKKFRFNVTRKSFEFNVESQDDQELKFGIFTLKKVGFMITNEPPKPDTPKALEA